MPATVEKETRTYTIQFPASYPLRERLSDLQKANPDFILTLEDENSLKVAESAFLLEDYGYFGIKLPDFTAEMFDELHELNTEINFEFDDKEKIFIKMPIFALIGLLTALISASLVAWVRSRKNGNVYSDPTSYEIDDPERPGKKLHRIPDISFISFDSVSEEEQDNWDSFIPTPPNLVIEIVSAKRGLKGDLKKMETIWMKSGADVGLVICPFSETIYTFNSVRTRHSLSMAGYTTQSIHQDFSHPYLVGYSDNFGKYLKKKKK
jgi:Uma2 family endonuclease